MYLNFRSKQIRKREYRVQNKIANGRLYESSTSSNNTTRRDATLTSVTKRRKKISKFERVQRHVTNNKTHPSRVYKVHGQRDPKNVHFGRVATSLHSLIVIQINPKLIANTNCKQGTPFNFFISRGKKRENQSIIEKLLTEFLN